MSKLTRDKPDHIDFKAFKDGIADGLLRGTRNEEQRHYCYKQGYDFGITLYCDLMEEENCND